MLTLAVHLGAAERDYRALSHPVQRLNLAVLADLGGPKIRIGALKQPVELSDKTKVVIAPEGEARDDELPATYEDLAKDVKPGNRILLDDGLMELRVTEKLGAR